MPTIYCIEARTIGLGYPWEVQSFCADEKNAQNRIMRAENNSGLEYRYTPYQPSGESKVLTVSFISQPSP